MKSVTFYLLGKMLKSQSFWGVRKSFVKAKSKGKSFNKSYSLRFIDIVRLMNDSLDPLVDNSTRNLYNMKCKHCMKCRDCQNLRRVKMMALNGMKRVNLVTHYQMYCTECNKIYKHFLSVVLNM